MTSETPSVTVISGGCDLVVTPKPGSFRLGPLGFHLYAADFLRAGRAVLDETHPFSPVAYHLFARSIELSLKSCLVIHHVSVKVLRNRPFGHNLIKLLDECMHRGLLDLVPMTIDEQDVIRQAATYYMDKVFEYFDLMETVSGYPNNPSLVLLSVAASTLVDGLEKPCLDASNDV